MQETYTFSRALHMMRYGRKKMKAITDDKEDEITHYIYSDGDSLFYQDFNGAHGEVRLTSKVIMGSWVEVK